MRRYVSARLAQIDNRHDDALKGYLRLFKADPDSPEISDRLFENAIVEGDMQNALRAARAMELRREGEAAAPLMLFVSEFKKANWIAAEAAIAQLDTNSNYGFIKPILSGWVNIARGRAHGITGAEIRSSALLSYYSADQRIYFDLAAGNMAEAKRQLSTISAMDADYIRDLAIRAAPVFAGNGDVSFARALLHNRVDEDFLNNALSGNSKFSAEQGAATIFVRLANTLIDQGTPEQGLMMSRLAHWIDPSSDPAKLGLSRALYEQGYANKADDILQSIGPSSAYWLRASSVRVKRLTENGENNDALKLAEQVYAIRPQSPNALLLLGQTQEQAEQFTNAANSYAKLANGEDAQNRSPRHKALYYLFLATAQDKAGDWSAAKVSLSEGKALDPNNAYILNYLGFSMLERGEDVPTALKLLKTAYSLAPDSSAIADSLGWAYYLSSDYSKAIGYLETALRTSSNDQAINEHLGDAYWRAGQRVSARYAWKKAVYQAAEAEAELRLKQKIDVGLPAAVSRSQ